MTFAVNVIASAVPFFDVDVDSWCNCVGYNNEPDHWDGDGCAKATVPASSQEDCTAVDRGTCKKGDPDR